MGMLAIVFKVPVFLPFLIHIILYISGNFRGIQSATPLNG